jgi:hypothetical protein
MPTLPPTRVLPFPPWLLAVDLGAATVLAVGLLALVASSSLPVPVPVAAAWTLVAAGAFATLVASLALLRHARACAAPR